VTVYNKPFMKLCPHGNSHSLNVLPVAQPTLSMMIDLRFSQKCCWRFKYYWMWHFITGQMVSTVFKTTSVFILTLKMTALQSIKMLRNIDPATVCHNPVTWHFNGHVASDRTACTNTKFMQKKSL